MDQKKYERLLGFDFGTRRIGSAFGQTVTNAAKPLAQINNSDDGPDWPDIQALIKEWQPEALIVGLPLNMDDSRQFVTELAQDFAKQLEDHFHLPVYFMDERLTTKEARAQLFEQGGLKALKSQSIDAYAAKLIVESWMRKHA